MKLRKIAIAACSAGVLLAASAPASAAAFLIGGKWYFFSLDYDATLKKVTGRELNDGLTVTSNVTITGSQTLCGNPQGNVINPGVGPTLSTTATSDPVDPTDPTQVDKADRSKSTFKKTVQVPLEPLLPSNACVSPANSANGQWTVLYWQNKLCNRGTDPTTYEYTNMCYSDFAYKKDGVLYYAGSGDEVGDETGWTFVYLPTNFYYKSIVNVNLIPTSAVEGNCKFANNTNGQPYSLSNPPVGGWASARTLYTCTEVPTQP